MSDRDAPPYYQVLMMYVESRLPHVLRAQMGVSDVVQSVYRVAEDRSEQFRGESSKEYRGWLIRIAERKITDAMRRFRRRSCPLGGERDAGAVGVRDVDFETPEAQMLLAEQSRLLMEAIAGLPSELRVIVMLRYTSEFTFAEIAEQMELSESTCQRRWFEGVRLLSDRLSEVLR